MLISCWFFKEKKLDVFFKWAAWFELCLNHILFSIIENFAAREQSPESFGASRAQLRVSYMCISFSMIENGKKMREAVRELKSLHKITVTVLWISLAPFESMRTANRRQTLLKSSDFKVIPSLQILKRNTIGLCHSVFFSFCCCLMTLASHRPRLRPLHLTCVQHKPACLLFSPPSGKHFTV